MSTDSKRCKVTIFGNQYSLVSDENHENVTHAARMVDDLMTQIAEHMSLSNTKDIAILAALQMASKVITSKDNEAAIIDQSEKIIEKINKETSSLV